MIAPLYDRQIAPTDLRLILGKVALSVFAQARLEFRFGCRVLYIFMQRVFQKCAAFAPSMPVKHTKVEDLRVTAGAICTPVLQRRSGALDSHRRRGSLCKGRNIKDASLVCILIRDTSPTGCGSTEVVFRSAQRYADDGGLAVNQRLEGGRWM